MPQKILLLTKNYPPQIGGIETYAFNLFSSLKNQGYTVFLIKAGSRNELFFSKHKSSRIYFFLYYISELFRLFFFFVKSFTKGFYFSYKSDVIWSLDGSIASISFILGKTFRNKKTKVTLHALDVVWDNWMYQKIMPWFWSHSSEVICLNSKIQKILMDKGLKDNLVLIPHSLETMYFDDPGYFDKSDFLNKFNIPLTKILLFSLGRFVEKKGFHWFLKEVLPKLNSSQYHFVLTGAGPMENQYKSIISEKKISNVTLTGSITDSLEKAKMFLSVNYFLMPTILVAGDCEGYPITLLEAQHYGLPVILSKELLYLGYNNPNSIYIPLDPVEWVKFFSFPHEKS